VAGNEETNVQDFCMWLSRGFPYIANSLVLVYVTVYRRWCSHSIQMQSSINTDATVVHGILLELYLLILYNNMVTFLSLQCSLIPFRKTLNLQMKQSSYSLCLCSTHACTTSPEEEVNAYYYSFISLSYLLILYSVLQA